MREREREIDSQFLHNMHYDKSKETGLKYFSILNVMKERKKEENIQNDAWHVILQTFMKLD